jgi:hypothetical protein
MRHTVKLHGVIVGHSELEHAERDVGRAWGAFRPGLGYELVQPVFRLFSQAVPTDGSPRDEAKLERYFAARDALHLTLENAAGETIETSAIHIADYTVEAGPTAIALDVLIGDDDYWSARPESD